MTSRLTALCMLLLACPASSRGSLRGYKAWAPNPWPSLPEMNISNSATKPRVRREIRTLTASKREAVFAALNIMKNTSQEDGEHIYGPDFLNYDRMVLMHLRASMHPRCDQGHLGPAFFTFHRAIALQAERSLVAIDQNIEGLPYWDMEIDFRTGNPEESVLWSEDWFGEHHGDENDMHMIRTGRFKHWHVVSNASDFMANFPVDSQSSDHSPEFRNPYNFLRGVTNMQWAPRLTRSRLVCGKEMILVPPPGPGPKPVMLGAKEEFKAKAAQWNQCYEMEPNSNGILDFSRCADPGPHGFYHPFIGGAWGAKDGHCLDKQDSRVASDVYKGCIICAECQRGEECLCHRNETRCAELLTTRTCTKDPISGECMTCGQTCADGQFGATGDGYEVSGSPNDPLFLFHHANVDRLLVEWQLRVKYSQHAPLPFSGFPTTGMCKGHNLNDVISERDPFFGSLLGWQGRAAEKRLTSADLLEATTPGSNGFYTYDSVV